MSLSVIFYNIAKKQNSTKRPGSPEPGQMAMLCVLKGSCSELHPVLEVNYQSVPAGNAPIYNYAHIPSLGDRYYWVTDWTYANGLWIAYLDVDVLGTYKDQIGTANLYLLRSSYDMNGKLTDLFYPMSNSYTITEVGASIISSSTAGWYVVGVVGKVTEASAVASGISYLVMSAAVFKEFRDALFADDLGYAYYGQSAADAGLAQVGSSLAKLMFDPFKYIVSVCWTPVKPPVTETVHVWNVGFWFFTTTGNIDVMDPKAYPAHTTVRMQIPKRRDARGDYTNCAPFTEISLFVPTVGMIPIDTTKVMDSTHLQVRVYYDVVSQSSTVRVLAEHGDAADLLSVHPAGYVVPIQLSSSGVTVMSSALNAVAAIGTTATSVMGAAGAGAGSLIGAASSGISSPLGIFQPHVESVGQNGGFTFLTQQAILYARFYQLVADDNTHHGRPLCRMGTPINYPGFLQILDGDLGIESATREELQEIKRHLETGFFFE